MTFDPDDVNQSNRLLQAVAKAVEQTTGDTWDIRNRVFDSSGNSVDPLNQSDATPITATASGTGSANAGELDLGTLRKDVDIFVDTSGAATLTVETSTDGSTWRAFDTVDYGSATTAMEQYDTAYRHVRAYLDANSNTVELASKGIE